MKRRARWKWRRFLCRVMFRGLFLLLLVVLFVPCLLLVWLDELDELAAAGGDGDGGSDGGFDQL